jgi:hypothetical protein
MYRAMMTFVILCEMFFFGSLHAAWSAPTNVSAVNGVDLFPQIAVNGNGDATAVWYNATYHAIQASSKPFGSTWEAELTISQLPIIPHTHEDVDVVMDSQGNATAIWTAYGESRYIIQASTKPFGGPWQAEAETLSVDPAYDIPAPDIAVDERGNATAVWIGVVGSDLIVQAAIKPFGASWQAPVNISQTGVQAYFASIAADRNGNVIVVWTGAQGGTPIIQSSTKLFGEAWQEPETFAQITPVSAPPQIGIDLNGNAFVAWEASDGTNGFIQSSTKPFNGAWQETPDTLPGSLNGAFPQIAVDSMGNATVIWPAFVGTNFLIRASTKPFNGTWQEVPDLLSGSQQGLFPQIAVDSLGNVSAVWTSYDGTNLFTAASTKPFGLSWQPTPDILSPANVVSPSQIAIDGSGNATAVWLTDDGDNIVVQSATNFFGLSVATVRPTSGPKKGGNTVTITGTNFVDVSAVYFGCTPSPSFTVNSPTTITAVVPEGKGTVDVTVTASSQTSPVTPTGRYTYRRFKGKVKHHRKKLFVQTKWNKSVSNVAEYEIFARKKKIATVPAQNPAQATIRLHPHNVHHEISNKYRHYLQHKYKVRAIDSDGTASAFTFLDVHR